ncbi:MAG: YigZ family protein [Lachnospiraceae bacterium]|nr:YigZ family protein [Lachnospiraceae bacterium]
MRTINEESVGKIEVKKSRFIATLRPVESKEEAEAFVAEMKKQYWDARHNCSAYVLPATKESGIYVHSSDDGEPSGTAGKPMLTVLQGNDLEGVAVVVTRYFGGVLLGTGGLVRSYQDAVSEAVKNAKLLERSPMTETEVTVDYSLVGRIQNFLSAHADVVQKDAVYEASVRFVLLFPQEEAEALCSEIVSLTDGKAVLTEKGQRVELVPV